MPVILHHLSQKLRPAQHGKLPAHRLLVLWIVRVNRRRVHHHIQPIHNIIRPLAIINPGSVRLQLLCKTALMGIRSADRKTLLYQNLCQPTHTNPPNPDKMNGLGPIKIYLVHADLHLIFILYDYVPFIVYPFLLLFHKKINVFYIFLQFLYRF